MTRPNLALAAAALAVLTAATPAAMAQQNEIVAILNTARNDADYGSLSYRRALGPSLDEGLKLRLEIARGRYDFDFGVPVTGEIDTLRVLLGYSVMADPVTKITFYGGVSARDRSHDPLVAGLEDEDDLGLFLAAEVDHNPAAGGNLGLLAEYDAAFETFYVSGYGAFAVGGVKLGPTLNYLDEGDYSRRAFGLRVQVPFGADSDFVGTAAYARGGVSDAPDVDSSYLELQLRTRF